MPTSIPPKIEAKSTAYLSVAIPSFTWVKGSGNPKIKLVWWGDDGKGSFFYPLQAGKDTHKFPIKCSFSRLLDYFKDMGSLDFTVFVSGKQVGQASISNLATSLRRPECTFTLPVSRPDSRERIADLKLVLRIVDVTASPPTAPPAANTTQTSSSTPAVDSTPADLDTSSYHQMGTDLSSENLPIIPPTPHKLPSIPFQNTTPPPPNHAMDHFLAQIENRIHALDKQIDASLQTNIPKLDINVSPEIQVKDDLFEIIDVDAHPLAYKTAAEAATGISFSDDDDDMEVLDDDDELILEALNLGMYLDESEKPPVIQTEAKPPSKKPSKTSSKIPIPQKPKILTIEKLHIPLHLLPPEYTKIEAVIEYKFPSYSGIAVSTGASQYIPAKKIVVVRFNHRDLSTTLSGVGEFRVLVRLRGGKRLFVANGKIDGGDWNGCMPVYIDRSKYAGEVYLGINGLGEKETKIKKPNKVPAPKIEKPKTPDHPLQQEQPIVKQHQPIYFHLSIRHALSFSILPTSTPTLIHLSFKLSNPIPILTPLVLYTPMTDFKYSCTIPISKPLNTLIIEVWVSLTDDEEGLKNGNERLLGLLKLPSSTLFSAANQTEDTGLKAPLGELPYMIPMMEYAITDPFSGGCKGWIEVGMGLGSWEQIEGFKRGNTNEKMEEDFDKRIEGVEKRLDEISPLRSTKTPSPQRSLRNQSTSPIKPEPSPLTTSPLKPLPPSPSPQTHEIETTIHKSCGLKSTITSLLSTYTGPHIDQLHYASRVGVNSIIRLTLLPHLEDSTIETKCVAESFTPVYNHTEVFTLDGVDDELIEYFDNGQAVGEVLHAFEGGTVSLGTFSVGLGNKRSWCRIGKSSGFVQVSIKNDVYKKPVSIPEGFLIDLSVSLKGIRIPGRFKGDAYITFKTPFENNEGLRFDVQKSRYYPIDGLDDIEFSKTVSIVPSMAVCNWFRDHDFQVDVWCFNEGNEDELIGTCFIDLWGKFAHVEDNRGEDEYKPYQLINEYSEDLQNSRALLCVTIETVKNDNIDKSSILSSSPKREVEIPITEFPVSISIDFATGIKLDDFTLSKPSSSIGIHITFEWSSKKSSSPRNTSPSRNHTRTYSTPTVYAGVNPKWGVEFTVYSTDLITDIKTGTGLEFKVWSSVKEYARDPILIGIAHVGLSPLLCGFESLKGWYKIVGMDGQECGQVLLGITPMTSVSIDACYGKIVSPVLPSKISSTVPLSKEDPVVSWKSTMKQLDALNKNMQSTLYPKAASSVTSLANTSNNKSVDFSELIGQYGNMDTSRDFSFDRKSSDNHDLLSRNNTVRWGIRPVEIENEGDSPSSPVVPHDKNCEKLEEARDLHLKSVYSLEHDNVEKPSVVKFGIRPVVIEQQEPSSDNSPTVESISPTSVKLEELLSQLNTGLINSKAAVKKSPNKSNKHTQASNNTSSSFTQCDLSERVEPPKTINQSCQSQAPRNRSISPYKSSLLNSPKTTSHNNGNLPPRVSIMLPDDSPSTLKCQKPCEGEGDEGACSAATTNSDLEETEHTRGRSKTRSTLINKSASSSPITMRKDTSTSTLLLPLKLIRKSRSLSPSKKQIARKLDFTNNKSDDSNDSDDELGNSTSYFEDIKIISFLKRRQNQKQSLPPKKEESNKGRSWKDGRLLSGGIASSSRSHTPIIRTDDEGNGLMDVDRIAKIHRS